MAKREVRPVEHGREAGRGRDTARRVAGAPEAGSPARPRAEVQRLTAEVERLEAELAATRARMAELEARADIDPLTGIPNRRGFARELQRALAYVRRYAAEAALLFVDLDRFKAINDAQGHAAGDAVLRAVAGVLTAQVRASDIVGRYGGDEFVVLLWHIGPEQAAAKAVSLERALTAAAGASIGWTMLLPDDSEEAVLGRADAAMYRRKDERGGG